MAGPAEDEYSRLELVLGDARTWGHYGEATVDKAWQEYHALTAEAQARNAEQAEIWVHGAPARSWEQVAEYVNGDAHARSKLQILVGGRFYPVKIGVGTSDGS